MNGRLAKACVSRLGITDHGSLLLNNENPTMFQPSTADVRRFFCAVLAKQTRGEPMQPIEALAGQWIDEHPEYRSALHDAEAAVAREYGGEAGQVNPFLHLSMHLSLSEQCSIDQPKGIRQAVELLAARRNDLHAAHHEAMECLGRMLWESQRSGQAPDADAYIDAIQRLATGD